ncbi:MAG: hypothetical protein HZB51_18210 [Chloroflexi bacterium]|nr:hypothetical protein [Chloroflexota bacterium]
MSNTPNQTNGKQMVLKALKTIGVFVLICFIGFWALLSDKMDNLGSIWWIVGLIALALTLALRPWQGSESSDKK